MGKFRFRARDKRYIQPLIDSLPKDIPLEPIKEEDWPGLIQLPEAVLICCPWEIAETHPQEGLFPVMRLCSACGREVACHPDNASATKIICMICAATKGVE
jgi:hypothetical protein